jgi:hypothetical protein
MCQGEFQPEPQDPRVLLPKALTYMSQKQRKNVTYEEPLKHLPVATISVCATLSCHFSY